MALDKGIATARDWTQNSGVIAKTPAYDVFRHFSQLVDPGVKVVGTSGGGAIAFENPEVSAKTSIVSVGGKKLSRSLPGNGWATINYKP